METNNYRQTSNISGTVVGNKIVDHPDVHQTGKYMETTNYRRTSNISGTVVGNKIVDHPDVVGASPIGSAPTTSSFST